MGSARGHQHHAAAVGVHQTRYRPVDALGSVEIQREFVAIDPSNDFGGLLDVVEIGHRLEHHGVRLSAKLLEGLSVRDAFLVGGAYADGFDSRCKATGGEHGRNDPRVGARVGFEGAIRIAKTTRQICVETAHGLSLHDRHRTL